MILPLASTTRITPTAFIACIVPCARGYLLPQSGVEEKNRKMRAKELLGIIGRLGPAIIKAGQALASRPDLLPKEYLDELQKLQVKGYSWVLRSWWASRSRSCHLYCVLRCNAVDRLCCTCSDKRFWFLVFRNRSSSTPLLCRVHLDAWLYYM